MSKEQKRALLQIVLFLTTFVTTTMAGSWWVSQKTAFTSYFFTWNSEFTWNDFLNGMHFSIPFMLILTVHEFGHYVVARYHKVKATLPFYIPLPPFPLMIGTMGAVIRLLNPVPSNKQNFDIGIAGPLAGFVMTLIVLFYGFTNLPPAEYIFEIHPEYKKYGLDYAQHVYDHNDKGVDILIGKNLLFLFFEHVVADPSRMPNPHEIMHYPYLFAGYLALVFTFLNLIPVGQLDGGHVLYGLAGFKNHKRIASVFFVAFMFYAGLGNSYINPSQPIGELILWAAMYVAFLYLSFTGLRLSKRDTWMFAVVIFGIQFLLAKYLPSLQGYEGWLIFGFILGRFVGVQHPPCMIEEPLDTKRIVLGWLAILIFIISFSATPIVLR